MSLMMPVGSSLQGLPPSPEHRRLVDGAQQFEGMLLQEMLKPMKEHGFCGEEDEDGAEGRESYGDTLSSYGCEAVATAISKGGGLGIAKRVVEQVERSRFHSGRDPRIPD